MTPPVVNAAGNAPPSNTQPAVVTTVIKTKPITVKIPPVTVLTPPAVTEAMPASQPVLSYRAQQVLEDVTHSAHTTQSIAAWAESEFRRRGIHVPPAAAEQQ